MGDYANDAIERDLGIYLNEMHGDSSYEEDLGENLADCTNYVKVSENDNLEFKSIKKETPKAWLLIMSGDAEYWFPKSKCSIKNNILTVPKWLLRRIAGWE